MRPIEGPPVVGGGLELIGARPLPAEAAIGGPLRIGLLWRATQDAPSAQQLTLRLVRNSGEVVQESILPLLGGRLSPSALHDGNVVRDEETLVVDARVPSESLAVEVICARRASASGQRQHDRPSARVRHRQARPRKLFSATRCSC